MFKHRLLTVALLAPFAAANAAPPDVSAVETEIEGALTPIGVIGAAVLLVIVGIKVFKWVRRAM
ncbi:MAG: filamentous major capsid protein B [Inoviridae sp. ctBZ32]|nr:MAG: filamentous major capsid protein B [Inoviridae sp. ctBZ32]